MVHGVTYGGEIGRVGASTDPQHTVELVCTDPRFVELAAAKKPNFIIRLFNGALSFPRDWWYGATFLSTRLGLLGAEGKAATDGTANMGINVLETIWANPAFALRTLRAVIGHLISYPELYARIGATAATSFAISAATGSVVYTFALGTLNLVLATTGAVMRAIDNGATSLAEFIIAAAIGESDPAIARMVSRDLQMARPAAGTYDIPSDQEAYLIYVLQGVLHCLRNPGMYAQNGEQTRIQRTVPVGQVSSMRPNGVMGSIPVGYETNALDAISENNRPWLEYQRRNGN
jgi:hypothetical protein